MWLLRAFIFNRSNEALTGSIEVRTRHAGHLDEIHDAGLCPNLGDQDLVWW